MESSYLGACIIRFFSKYGETNMKSNEDRLKTVFKSSLCTMYTVFSQSHCQHGLVCGYTIDIIFYSSLFMSYIQEYISQDYKSRDFFALFGVLEGRKKKKKRDPGSLFSRGSLIGHVPINLHNQQLLGFLGKFFPACSSQNM